MLPGGMQSPIREQRTASGGRRGTVIRASMIKSSEHDAENVEPPEQKKKRQFDYMTSDVVSFIGVGINKSLK